MAKILIVDDSPDLLDFIALLLKRRSNEVETIGDAAALHDKLASFTPDIILMDVRLKLGNGREVCRNIKAGVLTKQIKVILMSASPELLLDFSDCGADGIVEKPFDVVRLCEIVESVLK